MSRPVLVTGAAGFVGRALCARLAGRGVLVRAATRDPAEICGAAETVALGDIAASDRLDEAMTGIAAAVHLAGRAHVRDERAADPLGAYRQANVTATERLAAAALRAGVRRFVYLSSVKVNGERTAARPFTESDEPAPEDAYGITKREAEDALRACAAGGSLEPVILRPPLIYGPGVRANFLALIRLCDSGLPLPFASLRNARSLLGLANLCDAIALCLDHPAAAGETFLLSDGEDVSTAGLVRAIRAGLGRPARLVPVPPVLLRTGLALAGRRAMADRLLGSLAVDSSHARRVLGWVPRQSLTDGLASTLERYRAGHGTTG